MSKLTTSVSVALVHATLVSGVRTLPDCSSGPLASNGICDTTASPAERASALVSVMNTDEKLDNLVRSVPTNATHPQGLTYSV